MFLCTLVYITVGVCGYTAFKDRFASDSQCKCIHRLQHVPLRQLTYMQQSCLSLHVLADHYNKHSIISL